MTWQKRSTGSANSLPSISGGLHDEVEVVPALPLAAGVSEVHLPPVLGDVQVVDKREPPTADHVTSWHQGRYLTFSDTDKTEGPASESSTIYRDLSMGTTSLTGK